VVGICENPHQPLSSCIPSIEEDKAAAVEHYVIGYMAFWHIAFVDESRLVPCNDDALRTEARQKIDRYIADHPPIETFPRFYDHGVGSGDHSIGLNSIRMLLLIIFYMG
jgi:hypothetical protein